MQRAVQGRGLDQACEYKAALTPFRAGSRIQIKSQGFCNALTPGVRSAQPLGKLLLPILHVVGERGCKDPFLVFERLVEVSRGEAGRVLEQVNGCAIVSVLAEDGRGTG